MKFFIPLIIVHATPPPPLPLPPCGDAPPPPSSLPRAVVPPRLDLCTVAAAPVPPITTAVVASPPYARGWTPSPLHSIVRGRGWSEEGDDVFAERPLEYFKPMRREVF
jgi:hypothetical protein